MVVEFEGVGAPIGGEVVACQDGGFDPADALPVGVARVRAAGGEDADV